MPPWMQVTLATAAFIGAVSVIWTKLVRPGAALLATIDVLQQIAGEFRTNSGSSLRDAVDRIERIATQAQATGDALGAQVRQLMIMADRLSADNQVVAANLVKAQEAVDGVASALVVANAKVEHVADDLAQSHVRADEAPANSPGEAADAAAKSPEPKED